MVSLSLFTGLRRRHGRKRSSPRRPDRPPSLEALERRDLLSGTWTALTNGAPADIGTMMLLPDGTVMAQRAGATKSWYRLTPDAAGNYVHGTWSQLASMNLEREYYGSNVLPDGRVFIVGGEYSGPQGTQNFTNTGEIYNPVTNTWSNITNFPNSQFGDDPTEVLPDGRVLAGYLSGPQTYIYNPGTNSWAATGSKLNNDRSDEETWVKLPDNSILTYDIFALGHAQRYLPASGVWADAGNAPNNLSSSTVGDELGPALQLPDGRVFYIGATGQTAYFTPSSNTWVQGPAVPGGYGADDAPGAVLPNGKVLFAADRPLFNGPTHIFEFDPTTNVYTDVTPSIIIYTGGPSFVSRMLVLPTGQVLLTTSTNQLAVYTPDGSAQAAWQPVLSDIVLNPGHDYTLRGFQLNGISEGASYGDDAEMSSNYPIVQFSNGTNTYYARSHDWSSTGIATGASTLVSTQFTLPPAVTGGVWTVKVIANGIASNGVVYNFSPTGSWTPVTAKAPEAIGPMMLLSDGTVMAQDYGTGANVNKWFKLTPDNTGSYVNGTWSSLASMSTQRLYFGSGVLPDGRVLVVGGANSGPMLTLNWTNTGEIYNPVTNTWSNITNFPLDHFGDDPIEVLPDGRVLAGYIFGPQTFIYNPTTNSWVATVTKLLNDRSAEDTWVKLADNSILTYDVFAPGYAQRYVPASETWVDAGAAPPNLVSSGSGNNLGPAFRLPDGRAFFIGGTGHTAFYNPATNTWVSGPDVPGGYGADDASGALEPNGHILFAADTPLLHGPTHLFDFDPTTNAWQDVTPPSNIISTSAPSYISHMLVLPSGQVLVATWTDQLAVWTPTGSAQAAWQPTISSISPNGGTLFTLTGTQLNGISEGASYGDDAQMASNYPIVQFSNSQGQVYYARSHDWNATGIAGNGATATLFNLPSQVTGGIWTVKVIANGIASNGFTYNFSPATHFSVIAGPFTTTAGTAFNVTVTALDASNNVANSYRGTVHFSSTDVQAMLPSNYTFTTADNGVQTFIVTLETAGNQTVTATDTVTNSIAGNVAITVNPAALDHFSVTTSADSTGTVAGTPFNVTVTAQDAYGNTVTGYLGTITFSSGDPFGATLPPDYTFQPSDQGRVTFARGATLYTAGTWDVTATDTASGLTGAANVSVMAAPAVGLEVMAPASSVSGTPFDVTIVAVDPYGNTDTNYTGTVTFSTSDGDPNVVLPPDYTFTSADAGMVTFGGGVTLITLGDQSLTVTDTVSGITGTATVTVTAGTGPIVADSGFGKDPPLATFLPAASGRPLAAGTGSAAVLAAAGANHSGPGEQPLRAVPAGSITALDQYFGADPLASGVADTIWTHRW
jgi:hypothetical protein